MYTYNYKGEIQMKSFKICIIISVIMLVACVAVLFGFKKINFTAWPTGIEDEVVVDNEISLKAKEIHDYMRENGYGYCTYDYRCNHDGECGLDVRFEKSKVDYHNTCCATYVSWVLQETGYITAKEHKDNNLNGANNLIRFLEQKGWKEVNKDEMKPGDIMCYNGHVAIYGGAGKQYDAGSKQMIETVAPCKVSWGMSMEKVLRAPEKAN